MPNTYNLDEVRSAFLEGLGKARLMTSVVKTTTATLTGAEDLVLADATAGNFTISLPASPEDGDTYEFVLVSASNTLTIGRNGKTINGAASNDSISTPGAAKTLTWSATFNSWISR